MNIFIDSQVAIEAFASNRSTSSLALECRDVLDSLSRKKNCITLNPKHSKHFNKRNINRLTDTLTTHCSLNHHLKPIGKRDSSDFDKCGGIETAEHYL